MKSNRAIYYRCFYSYSVSGMAVLAVGAILPSLIREAGISYLAAGGLLSVMAIGNLFASLVFPACVNWVGTRRAIGMITALVPVSYLILTFLPPLSVMYVLMFSAGICRGSITILNNQIVNDVSSHSPRMLNILHCSFAAGAFLSPFLTGLLIRFGFGWQVIMYLLAFLCAVSTLLYSTLPYERLTQETHPGENGSVDRRGENRGFMRSFDFYCTGLLLFFYLGTENCVNGWFVTYLQSTGIMSESFAAGLVSITWLVIMVGRLAGAFLTKWMKTSTMILIDSIGSGLCFFVIIGSSSLWMITGALICFGFFFSGIYPSAIANAGPFIQGSPVGMSILTAISAMGGILFPQLVGGVADQVGIVAAISVLVVNEVLVVAFAAVNFKRMHSCPMHS